MRLLGIETATAACSAALWVDGRVLGRCEVAPRRHAQLILPMCEALLGEAGIALASLDAVAFGRGPGAFTGVRIAAGVAQGLALSQDLPVVPISTLAALAQGALEAPERACVAAALDARMGEVYWGCYERDARGCARRLGEEHVVEPAAVPVPAPGPWYGVGCGWAAYAETLGARLGERLGGADGAALPEARHLLVLAARAYADGQAVSPERALPVYLRDQVATKANK